jgi:hypothetical protein
VHQGCKALAPPPQKKKKKRKNKKKKQAVDMMHSTVAYPFICPAASIFKAMAWIFNETVIS